MANYLSDATGYSASTQFDAGVPQLADPADIIEAFRVYHYGPSFTGDFNTVEGMEGHFRTLTGYINDINRTSATDSRVIVGNTTALAGEYIIANSASPMSVALPATPTEGDFIQVVQVGVGVATITSGATINGLTSTTGENTGFSVVYIGTEWWSVAAGGGGGGTISYQPEAPDLPEEGELWVDSDEVVVSFTLNDYLTKAEATITYAPIGSGGSGSAVGVGEGGFTPSFFLGGM